MKKYYRRIVWSFILTVILTYLGGVFISFSPTWIVNDTDPSGRTLILMLDFFVFIMLAICPLWDEGSW